MATEKQRKIMIRTEELLSLPELILIFCIRVDSERAHGWYQEHREDYQVDEDGFCCQAAR